MASASHDVSLKQKRCFDRSVEVLSRTPGCQGARTNASGGERIAFQQTVNVWTLHRIRPYSKLDRSPYHDVSIFNLPHCVNYGDDLPFYGVMGRMLL